MLLPLIHFMHWPPTHGGFYVVIFTTRIDNIDNVCYNGIINKLTKGNQMKEYNITLTENEIEIIKDALNYQNVEYYHKEIENAKKHDDDVAEKFYYNEWLKTLELCCKLIETTNH